jgi:hypothetical protein
LSNGATIRQSLGNACKFLWQLGGVAPRSPKHRHINVPANSAGCHVLLAGGFIPGAPRLRQSRAALTADNSGLYGEPLTGIFEFGNYRGSDFGVSPYCAIKTLNTLMGVPARNQR